MALERIVTASMVPQPSNLVPNQLLTGRWTPAKLDPRQRAYLLSPKRINYTYAGRRSFKTEAAKRRVVLAAITQCRWPDARFFACAPTQQQAEDIFWNDLKAMVPLWALRGASVDSGIEESTCTIQFFNGAMLRVAGLDKPQRIEGGFWDGGVVSEYADVADHVVAEHIMPMTLRGGWLDIEGVPGGRNHFFREVQAAEREIAMYEDEADIATHHWKTSEVLHLFLGREQAEAELLRAKKRLDPLTYRQEYEADWVTMEGQAYYPFNDAVHVKPVPYNPNDEIAFCFDFNASPGVAVVAQDSPDREHTYAIDEIYIERNSNTPAVCRQLLTKFKDHKGPISIFGDASGGAKGSAKVQGSDWTLVRKELYPRFENQISWYVPRANPAERARVNAMNSRLMDSTGRPHLFVHPRCPMLIRDLGGVTLVKGGTGEIDKNRDKYLTHISDALGYFIVRRYPTHSRNVTVA